jgi:hypothetical protein
MTDSIDLAEADDEEREEMIREAKRRNTKYGDLIESDDQ